MIDRYSTKRMQEVWSEQTKFDTYLKVEIAATRAWVNEGTVPQGDLDLIVANAKVDLKRLKEIEQITKHDVIAFTISR